MKGGGLRDNRRHTQHAWRGAQATATPLPDHRRSTVEPHQRHSFTELIPRAFTRTTYSSAAFDTQHIVQVPTAALEFRGTSYPNLATTKVHTITMRKEWNFLQPMHQCGICLVSEYSCNVFMTPSILPFSKLLKMPRVSGIRRSTPPSGQPICAYSLLPRYLSTLSLA